MTALFRWPLAKELVGVGAALSAGLLLPLLVHLIPVTSGPPAGARLLPIFFAPLLAALRFTPASALAIAVGSPLLNHLLTGNPPSPILGLIVLELLIFSLLALLLRSISRVHLAWLAPAAYLLSASLAALLLEPHLMPWVTLGATMKVAWPGLLALAALGFALGRRRSGVE